MSEPVRSDPPAQPARPLIGADDFLMFVDRALTGMIAIVEDLGDELTNRRPALPGANSPFALLTHCCGVIEYWAGALVAGRTVTRDRASEFLASGPVAPLVARVRAVRAQLADDVAAANPAAALRAEPPAHYLGPRGIATQGAALQHVYEELAQHHGQMEILRDLIAREALQA